MFIQIWSKGCMHLTFVYFSEQKWRLSSAALRSVSQMSLLPSWATGSRGRTSHVSVLSCKNYICIVLDRVTVSSMCWNYWWKLVWRLWLIFFFSSNQIWDHKRRSLQPLETGLGLWKDQGARVSRPLSSQPWCIMNVQVQHKLILTVISSLCLLQAGTQSKEEHHFCSYP